jgi:2-hydroxy-6-oxonona-2,4-dienedioate hydrolase
MNDFAKTASAATAQVSPAEFIAAIERASVRRATQDGSGEVVWRIWGRGDPLVLLHGGTGSWMHWMLNVEPLARDFTVLVPDLTGSGESATPPAPTSAEAIATSVRAGLASIIGADTSFAIAGFSMGGLIAGYVAGQAGALARCLVLVGASGTEAPRPTMEPLVSWRRLATDAEKRAVHRKNLGILMIRDPRKIDEIAVEMQSRNAEQSRVRGKHVSHTGALSRCLPGFPGRLAGIWGEYDATAAPYLAERREKLRQFRADASFDVVPGAGHWVQYEAHEVFNKRLAELLRS